MTYLFFKKPSPKNWPTCFLGKKPPLIKKPLPPATERSPPLGVSGDGVEGHCGAVLGGKGPGEATNVLLSSSRCGRMAVWKGIT